MKITMSRMTAACLLALSGVSMAGDFELDDLPESSFDVKEEAEPTKEATNSGKVVLYEEQATAKITKINKKTREITLKTEAGEVFQFVAGEIVENFAQMKKGDVVTTTYVEALAYELLKDGADTQATVAVAAAAAEPGQKPAAVVAGLVTVVVEVTAIDTAIPTVTFRGPAGNERTIRVRHPERLEGVSVGDKVSLSYAEAYTVSVEKKKKK